MSWEGLYMLWITFETLYQYYHTYMSWYTQQKNIHVDCHGSLLLALKHKFSDTGEQLIWFIVCVILLKSIWKCCIGYNKAIYVVISTIRVSHKIDCNLLFSHDHVTCLAAKLKIYVAYTSMYTPTKFHSNPSRNNWETRDLLCFVASKKHVSK